jgi:hypothetical protein
MKEFKYKSSFSKYLANPKSASFIVKSKSTKIFANFKSRCTILWSLKILKAFLI